MTPSSPHRQSYLNWVSLYTIFTSLLLIITQKVTTSSGYVTESSVSSEYLDVESDVAVFRHFNEPYDHRYYGKLNIDSIGADTNSIHVKWTLVNLTYPDSTAESTVICETFNGRIVSDKLHSSTNSFQFEFLRSNTKYIVCVYLLEKSKSYNSSILHYNCQPFSTIPMVRSDSVVGVCLTIGYLFLMGLIGYFTWLRRYKQKRHKEEEEERMRIEEEDDDQEDNYVRGLSYTSGRDLGFSNYGADTSHPGVHSGSSTNGDPSYKNKGGCVANPAACVRFPKADEDPMVYYNAKDREISF